MVGLVILSKSFFFSRNKESICVLLHRGFLELIGPTLPIRVKISKQNQNHTPFPASLFENAFFLVRMCHTLYFKVSSFVLLKPRGEKKPSFSFFHQYDSSEAINRKAQTQRWLFRTRRKMAAFFASSVALLYLPRLLFSLLCGLASGMGIRDFCASIPHVIAAISICCPLTDGNLPFGIMIFLHIHPVQI